MSRGTDHSFKSESDLESENEGEAKESEGSVDKPQSTSFPGMGIHHGSDPETYRCQVCNETKLQEKS